MWYQLSPAGPPHPHNDHPTEEVCEEEDLKIIVIETRMSWEAGTLGAWDAELLDTNLQTK